MLPTLKTDRKDVVIIVSVVVRVRIKGLVRSALIGRDQLVHRIMQHVTAGLREEPPTNLYAAQDQSASPPN